MKENYFQLSWGDMYVVAFSETLNHLISMDIFSDIYPNLIELRKRVLALPQIQSWVQKRPNTDI